MQINSLLIIVFNLNSFLTENQCYQLYFRNYSIYYKYPHKYQSISFVIVLVFT